MTAEDAIRIVRLTRDHMTDVATLVGDPAVQRFTRVPEPPPDDFAETWFVSYEAGRRDGTREAFAVIDGDGAFVGVAVAPAIDRDSSTVELGYVVMPAARGRGIAGRALALLTDWAFESLHARRVELYISVDNEASKRVAERNGYQFEGTLRSLYFKQDVRADTEIWSKLPADRRGADQLGWARGELNPHVP